MKKVSLAYITFDACVIKINTFAPNNFLGLKSLILHLISGAAVVTCFFYKTYNHSQKL